MKILWLVKQPAGRRISWRAVSLATGQMVGWQRGDAGSAPTDHYEAVTLPELPVSTTDDDPFAASWLASPSNVRVDNPDLVEVIASGDGWQTSLCIQFV